MPTKLFNNYNTMKLYGFYRREQISGNKDLGNVSQNGGYTISFYMGQFSDWISAGLISIKDMEIPNDRYTKELIPGVKDLREFVYMEYNPEYVDLELATTIINKIGARFDLELLEVEQAREFIRTHTDLEEVEEGKFLISEETEIIGETISTKYLIID